MLVPAFVCPQGYISWRKKNSLEPVEYLVSVTLVGYATNFKYQLFQMYINIFKYNDISVSLFLQLVV